MKCPYCNKEMWHPIGKPTWSCQNWSCMESEGMIGNHVLWQALIDTKKKLDIAVDALREICAGVPSDKWVFDTANKAINESTKKEQL